MLYKVCMLLLLRPCRVVNHSTFSICLSKRDLDSGLFFCLFKCLVLCWDHSFDCVYAMCVCVHRDAYLCVGCMCRLEGNFECCSPPPVLRHSLFVICILSSRDSSISAFILPWEGWNYNVCYYCTQLYKCSGDSNSGLHTDMANTVSPTLWFLQFVGRFEVGACDSSQLYYSFSRLFQVF